MATFLKTPRGGVRLNDVHPIEPDRGATARGRLLLGCLDSGQQLGERHKAHEHHHASSRHLPHLHDGACNQYGNVRNGRDHTIQRGLFDQPMHPRWHRAIIEGGCRQANGEQDHSNRSGSKLCMYVFVQGARRINCRAVSVTLAGGGVVHEQLHPNKPRLHRHTNPHDDQPQQRNREVCEVRQVCTDKLRKHASDLDGHQGNRNDAFRLPYELLCAAIRPRHIGVSSASVGYAIRRGKHQLPEGQHVLCWIRSLADSLILAGGGCSS